MGEWVVREDFHLKRVTVRVVREGDLSGSVQIHYATRDITAIGVHTTTKAECNVLAYWERGPYGCGDYMQESGWLYFGPHDPNQDITIELVDDGCYESEVEYFAIQL